MAAVPLSEQIAILAIWIVFLLDQALQLER